MSRQYIIPILTLVVVAAAVGSGWQFFFKAQLDKYAQDEAVRDEYIARLKALDKTFNGKKPELVVEKHLETVPAWRQAAAQRARYFKFGDLIEVPEVPEDRINRFFFEEEFNRMTSALEQDAIRQGCRIPNPGMSLEMFRVPLPENLAGKSLSKEEVNKFLTELAVGHMFLRRLMDAGALEIKRFVLWPPRREYNYVVMRTAGVVMSIRLNDLTTFLNEIRQDERYTNVNALRIQNSQLRGSDPVLEVEMLITMAQFLEGEAQSQRPSLDQAASATPASSAQDPLGLLNLNMGGPGGGSRSEPPKRSWWKDFRRKWLPF